MRSFPQQNGMRQVLLKIHVPFCVQTCDFCTRDVIHGRDTQRLHFYAMALQKEIEANAGNFSDCIVTAIHFGGGTASTIDGKDFYELCKAIRANYNVDKNAPVTMRSSALDINGGNVPFFRRAGVTRYDFETMSLECKDFITLDFPDTLGWIPDVSNVIHAFEKGNMGFVLLFGKNSITQLNFRRSLLAFVRGNASHLILQHYVGADVSTADEAEKRIDEARTLLGEHGFYEYLPLRFSKPGSKDYYSLKRAEGMDVIAFGMGAYTKFDGAKSLNTMDMETYFLHSDDFTKITVNAAPVDLVI